MENELPLVSIIIPTFNQDKYIQFCIDSCLKQTYNNIEIIVVDDGSTDSTPEILAGYGGKIKVITQQNKGAAQALNNGILQSNGFFVGWLSSDDAYLPEKIAMQVKQFHFDASVDISYTDWFSIDSKGIIIKEVKSPYFESDFLKNLLWGNFINGSSVLMKKSVWEDAGGFNTSLVADVDGFMWHKLLLEGKKFGHVAESLVYYRTHSLNQSSNMPLMRHFSDKVICSTLEKIPDSFLDQGRGEEGLYDFYQSYLKHLYKSFFWNSALFVSSRMKEINPRVINKLHIRINKFLIYFFHADNYINNRRIIRLFKFRSFIIKLLNRRKI